MNKKMIKISSSVAVSLGLVLALSAAFPAFAQVSVTASASGSSQVTTPAEAAANRLLLAKQRASQEITRRITALTALNVRVGEMVKISATDKASISSTLTGQITALNTLDTQISADTASTTLKTDIQSITDSYRIFLLILPKYTLLAGADRMTTIADAMATVGTKVQTRITAAQSGGANVTAADATLADYDSHVADANMQYAAIGTLVTPLAPDNGNTSIVASNKAALVSARADLKTGTADLIAARADLTTLLADLKSYEAAGVTASTTLSASVQ